MFHFFSPGLTRPVLNFSATIAAYKVKLAFAFTNLDLENLLLPWLDFFCAGAQNKSGRTVA